MFEYKDAIRNEINVNHLDWTWILYSRVEDTSLNECVRFGLVVLLFYEL